jgi:hypothetical protein
VPPGERYTVMYLVNSDGRGFGQEAIETTIPVQAEGTINRWLHDIAVMEIDGIDVAVAAGSMGILVGNEWGSHLYEGTLTHGDAELLQGELVAMGMVQDRPIAVVVARFGKVAGADALPLMIVDMTNPSSPEVIGYIDPWNAEATGEARLTSWYYDVKIVGETAYLASHDFVAIVSLADLAHPAITGIVDGIGGRIAVGKDGILYGNLNTNADNELGGVRTAALERGIFLVPIEESDLSRGYRVNLIGFDPEEIRSATFSLRRTESILLDPPLPGVIHNASFNSPLRLSEEQIAATELTPVEPGRPEKGFEVFWPIVANLAETYSISSNFPTIQIQPEPRQMTSKRVPEAVLRRQELVARTFAPIFIQRTVSPFNEETKASGLAFADYDRSP